MLAFLYVLLALTLLNCLLSLIETTFEFSINLADQEDQLHDSTESDVDGLPTVTYVMFG